MSSVGVFHKVDIDEKPFLVYTLTQTETQTSSGGENHPLQPLFLCPRACIKFLNIKLMMENYSLSDEDSPYDFPPLFLNTRSDGQQGESLLLLDICNHDGTCKLPLVPFSWCDDKESDYQFKCGACTYSTFSESYYACLECEEKFHKECVESPVEIKHPSHPFHSLRLYISQVPRVCISCGTDVDNMFYHCSTCELSMHTACAMKPVPYIIDQPKSHPHPLTFFPTQASLVCNICAMVKKLDPTYICIQCVFVIHNDCVGFPHVIRISRHPHRISFTSSLPFGKFSCGVCHQQVDNNYGAYSCNKSDAYFVHSKCALHPMVWDGKELEEVPEKDDMIDDGEPFMRIDDGIILHPFHSHHLRLEIFRAYDENKYCCGCALPVYEGHFYSCMECEFILHESCANASREKRHPLHPHPLTLCVATKEHGNHEGKINCSACSRCSTGFYYEHHMGGENFQLDLRCASIVEPFEYEGHIHPLFLPLDPYEESRCQMCKYESSIPKLYCMECDYTICFWCATFPYKARYKYDNHFLMISNGKEASDQPDWCEVCEGKLQREYSWENMREKGFYKCNDCCTALHVDCLLGDDIYMKPGEPIKDYTVESWVPDGEWTGVRIFLNSSLTRPICNGCMSRCPYPIFFKGHNQIYCSYDCIG